MQVYLGPSWTKIEKTESGKKNFTSSDTRQTDFKFKRCSPRKWYRCSFECKLAKAQAKAFFRYLSIGFVWKGLFYFWINPVRTVRQNFWILRSIKVSSWLEWNLLGNMRALHDPLREGEWLQAYAEPMARQGNLDYSIRRREQPESSGGADAKWNKDDP